MAKKKASTNSQQLEISFKVKKTKEYHNGFIKSKPTPTGSGLEVQQTKKGANVKKKNTKKKCQNKE